MVFIFPSFGQAGIAPAAVIAGIPSVNATKLGNRVFPALMLKDSGSKMRFLIFAKKG